MNFIDYWIDERFIKLINPFHATGFLLYPLKTSEN